MKKILLITTVFLCGCKETKTDDWEFSHAKYPIKVINTSVDIYGERRYTFIDSNGKSFIIWSGYSEPYKIGEVVSKP